MDSDTNLLRAAEDGDLSKIMESLEHGAYINAHGAVGLTPLHWAALKDRLDIVEYLVSKGADVTLRDEKGNTPKELALEFSNFDVSAFLNRIERNYSHRPSADHSPRYR